MPVRPCLGSPLHRQGHVLVRGGSRCPDCAAYYTRARDAKARQRRPDYGWAEQQRRAAAVRAHVEAYGWVCPGDQHHAPHPCTDLTADHITAVAAGGAEDGPLRVLCRSANSGRGKRPA